MRVRRTLALLAAVCFPPMGPGATAQQPRFTAISAGVFHACALDQEGHPWCWGVNDGGQVGPGVGDTCRIDNTDMPCSRRPVRIPTEVAFTRIFAGEWHTCALTAEGAAWCWGGNRLLGLGADSVPDRCASGVACALRPLKVAAAPPFTQLALGMMHTCGLTADAQVFCWGSSALGELGNDSATVQCPIGGGRQVQCRALPAPVGGLTKWRELAAVGQGTCALDLEGALYCWGDWRPTIEGKTGKRAYSRAPERVETSHPLHGLAMGMHSAAALAADSLPVEWAWEGEPLATNPLGQLMVDREKARRTGPTFTLVAAGVDHRCGLTAAGQAYCWGHNPNGQLGTGKGGDIWFTDPKGTWAPGEVTGAYAFRTISATAGHTCGLTGQGEVLCWGENVMGQLGIGSTDKSRKQPTPIAAP